MDNDDVLNLETFLPYRLSVLANTVSNRIAEGYRGRFGLSVADWRVMAVLARFPGSSAQDLVTKTRMDKVAISRGVARLLERDLIARSVSADDRRRSELRLSAAGEGLYRQIVPEALAYERELLSGLSDRHRALLDELLDDLLQAAEQAN